MTAYRIFPLSLNDFLHHQGVHEPRALVFVLRLRRYGGFQHSRGQTRRWFARMRAALSANGLVLGQRLGICAVMAVGRRIAEEDERLVVSWLVDQPEVEVIEGYQTLKVLSLLGGSVNFECSDSTITFSANDQQILRRLVGRVVIGAVVQSHVAMLRRLAETSVAREQA